MRSTAGTVIITLAAAAAAAIVLGLAVIYSGIVNIAATKPHYALTHWVLQTAMEHSVERHASGIAVPADLKRQDRLAEGFAHYDGMCVICHGGPGLKQTEISKGLRPKAPDLVEEADELSERELFWIVKEGIRMTGMPAFGPTHSDDELWSIVAFVKNLPRTKPEEYRQLRETAKHTDGDHHH